MHTWAASLTSCPHKLSRNPACRQLKWSPTGKGIIAFAEFDDVATASYVHQAMQVSRSTGVETPRAETVACLGLALYRTNRVVSGVHSTQ